MEKLKKALVRLGLVTLMPLTLPAFAEDYEAKICYNCNEAEAKEFALSKEFEPKLTCNSDDMFSPSYTQACYSKPTQVLVANYTNSQIWGFNVYHENQGSPEYLVSLKAEKFVVQDDAKKVMTDILTTYKNLDNAVAAINQELTNPATVFGELGTSNTFANSSNPSFGISSEQNCSDNSDIAQAVRAAFQASAISRFERYVQDYYDTNFADSTEEFDYARFTGISFPAGAGSVGIGGSWEYVTRTRAFVAKFYGDVPGFDDDLRVRNQVVYNISMDNGYIDIDVNKNGSVIDGLTLRSLEFGVPANVSPCFLEKLNRYLPANVQSGVTGGNFGDGNGGVDYGTGIGFIPRPSDSGGSSKTCTWRFYNPQGEQVFTMQGPCP